MWALVLACLIALSSAQTRNFLLASTGSQASQNSNPFVSLFAVNPLVNLGPNVDVIYLHLEEYGVPWTIFANQTEPPSNWDWTYFMQNLSYQASHFGKPVFIGMLIGRDQLANEATVGTNNEVVFTTPPQSCFDFSTGMGPSYKTAYIRFINYMINLFKPTYANIAVETNWFYVNCPGQWNAMVDVEAAAYDAVKAINSSIITFPSLTLPELYGNTATGLNLTHYNALAGLKRDRFAVSLYPYSLAYSNGTWYSPSEVPSDYVTRGGDYGNEITLVAETGWNSVGFEVNVNPSGNPNCIQVIPSTDQWTTMYMEYLFRTANSSSIDLIVWWSFWDLFPDFIMPVCFPVSTGCPSLPSSLIYWCQVDNQFRASGGFSQGDILMKQFGAMGLYYYNGTAKSSQVTAWNNMRAVPFAPKPASTSSSSSTSMASTSSSTSTSTSSSASSSSTSSMSTSAAPSTSTTSTPKVTTSSSGTTSAAKFYLFTGAIMLLLLL